MTDFSKEWQVICDGLRGRGRHLLETGLWSDCEVAVGAGEVRTSFRLHRTILAMASLVFAAEFYEGQSHTSLADVDPNVFRHLLIYIYTDECRVDSVEGACSLARLAYRLSVQPPIKACVVFLSARMNVENVLHILETAEFIKDSDLSNKALEIICRDTRRVLAHPSLLSVKVETLSMIFRQFVLAIDSEMELVFAAHKYANVHPTYPMENVTRHIRFLMLTQQEFTEVLAGPSLMTSDKSLVIFRKIVSPDEDIVMPHGFSTMTAKRIKITGEELINTETEETIDYVDREYLERTAYQKIIEELKIRESKNTLTITNLETERSTLKCNIDSLETDINKLRNDNYTLESKFAKLNDEINSSAPLRCTRTIDDVTIFKVVQEYWFYLYFKVNTDTTLVGLELPTQVLGESERRLYEEKLEIRIKFEGKVLTPRCTRQRRVPYNSLWDVLLCTPLNIKQNQEYEIKVYLFTPGRYPLADAADTAAVEATDSAGLLTVTWLRAGRLVRGLLFKK